jgi:fructose-specific phosphotransferase system IIC component
MPILVIPALSSLIVGLIMYKVVGYPIKGIMDSLTHWLEGINQGNKVLLGLILGAMIAFDMGGPVNKAAFFFGSAMIEKGNPYIMGACAAAICIPPIGLGLATVIARRLWSEQDREAGIAALAMGMIGITEGAIPFAAGDPLRVIPTIMSGSMVGAVLAMLLGVGDRAPHGGPIVLPVVINRFGFVIAVAAGVLTVAILINTLRFISQRKELAKEAATASKPELAKV